MVLATAEGVANIAFLFAGLVYVTVGLAYTELSAMYPLAGGGQLFVMRGLGDFWGFVAGWAVLLDFTIDIALFALGSAGYIDHFFPQLSHGWPLIEEAIVLVVFLLILNVVGVRESSKLNEIAAAIDIIVETTLIFIGFLFAFAPHMYASQFTHSLLHLDVSQLLFGTSLAIISFVGLESISQAAQETERPTTVIPRTSVALILTILIYAMALSNLALGVVSWESYSPTSKCGHLSRAACVATHNAHQAHQNAPVAWLAVHLPFVGGFIAPIIAILGALLLLISSNAGVYGSSRIMYSMSHNNLTPKVFTYVQSKFRTPVVSLSVFSGIAILELLFAGIIGGSAIVTLGDMYAFGAASSYTLVFVSLLTLRFTDPDTPRSFRVPWNVEVRRKGEAYQLPIVGVLGLLGIFSIFIMVILTHPIGRIAGPIWIILGIIGFYLYRKKRSLPFVGTVPRDWASEQLAVYEESGEHELAAEFREALQRRKRRGVAGGSRGPIT